MADDAFALSPISARASMPTEADYEAICNAFMETARGRWFLGEYAKRNRNADTEMVLDAVARIEATLAIQNAAAHHSLAEYLPDIAELIADARRRVLEALPQNDMRPATEPIQRAAGILRDVAWTLRESGADTRVCDLLDVQAKAIVDGCTRMHGDQAAPDVPAAVTAALDLLTRRIGALAKADAPQAKVPDQAELPAEVSQVQPQPAPPQAVASPAETLDVVAPDEPAASPQPTANAAEIAEAPVTREAAEQAPARLTPVEADVQANLLEELEITEIDPGKNLAEPEAATEPALAEASPLAADAKVAGPALARQEPPAPVVDDAPSAAPEVAVQQSTVAAEPEAAQKSAPSSLGQAALESGVVAALRSSRYSDALAPIRRMSQAEKIAFFS